MSIKYIIQQTATIREALVALDGNTHDWQTLFVLDDEEHMVGTLTDGDVRRGLIRGAALEDAVSAFTYLQKNKNKYNLDENKISIIGFSAGAHLALSSVIIIRLAYSA